MNFVEETGWSIFNGNIRGDEEGEFTYTGGRGSTVIDYVIGDEEVREKILELKKGDRIDSDHHTIKVWVEGGMKERNKKIEKRKDRGGRGVRDEEECRKFEQKLGRVKMGEREVEEGWEMMIERLGKAIEKTEKERIKGKDKGKG